MIISLQFWGYSIISFTSVNNILWDGQNRVSQIIKQVLVAIYIGKKTDLTVAVKSEIVKSIANGMRIINIEQDIWRDYHSFKKYVQDSEYQ